jgi:hypothetical protein
LGSTGPLIVRATAEGLQPGHTQIGATPLVGAMIPLADFDSERIQGLKPKGRW